MALPEFTASGGQLRMDGQPLHIKGASWFGAEGAGKVPDGLWVNNASFYLHFLSQQGFNALRLPFALDNLAANRGPDFDMVRAQPSWHGLEYLDVLTNVVTLAAQHGLLVLFDLQRLRSSRWPDDGLWYDGDLTLDAVKQGWDRLQQRLCGHWNVLGADILNEPHGATWSDWVGVAAELGNFLLNRCSRWVIFVEGVAHKGIEDRAGEYFWGENLADAGEHPVHLTRSDKLIYSPHTYGPGNGGASHHMPYFDEPGFPQNMPAIWNRHFGYLVEQGATVVVGEWGGLFHGDDRKWQEEFANFLRIKGLSSFYWSLNPNSGDTGGLLTSAWMHPESAKLALLRGLPSTSILPLLTGRPAFSCAASRAASVHRCADSSAGHCVLNEQVCNGHFECSDRSDELACAGVRRPCVTVAGDHPGQPCVFPFIYNGFQYDRCTSVDAASAWVLTGAGRCKMGYIAKLALNSVTLEQCKEMCASDATCSFISFADGGESTFCGGYSSACDLEPLVAGGSGGYQTYQFNPLGGAWCPTRVETNGQFLGARWSGTCGPGCGALHEDHDPMRSRCADGGAHSDGGPAHCAPSPPPPPSMPSPLPPLPSPPPPTDPPLAPPPNLLEEIGALVFEDKAIGTGAAVVLVIFACMCIRAITRDGSKSQNSHRRTTRRLVRPQHREPAFRYISSDELQVLADMEPDLNRPSLPHRTSTPKPGPSRARR